MTAAPLPAPTALSARAVRLLTAAEFHRLADVPPEVEWFANLSNPSTRRAYENAARDFTRFTGIARPEEFRTVTRAHLIAWRDDLVRRGLGGPTVRHRLASLSSLFEFLCEKNAITHNPTKGVERPKAESGEGKTPVLGDHQARALLAARIASPEMLPTIDLLPHVICSPPVFAGGGGHEAYQYDNTRRVGCGIGGAIRCGQPGGAGPDAGRVRGADGPSPQARNAAAACQHVERRIQPAPGAPGV